MYSKVAKVSTTTQTLQRYTSNSNRGQLELFNQNLKQSEFKAKT